jgi:ABC-type multidrug transport system fused ATPase/permease subunit
MEKILKIPIRVRDSVTIGQIVKHFTRDIQSSTLLIDAINMSLMLPINILVTSVLIYHEIGAHIFYGMILAGILYAISNSISKQWKNSFTNAEQFSQNKIKKIMEYINGIKGIKTNCWENYALSKITHIRERELIFQSKTRLQEILVEFIYAIAPLIVLLAIIISYTAFNPLLGISSAKVITLHNLLSSLFANFDMASWTVTIFMTAKESAKAIEAFLQSEEINENAIGYCENKGQIIIEDADFTYKILQNQKSYSDVEDEACNKSSISDLEMNTIDSQNSITLQKVNMTVNIGELIVIAGETASGKTALLLSVINELAKTRGQISTSNNIRYLPQTPWVINDTIRNNITMFSYYSEKKFQRSIELCELAKDLQALSDGADTLVGNRGINLSGGQKQRVSIARAIYNSGDIYLMDDCFSSLDAHISHQIFQNVILTELSSKTILLVSNTEQFLKYAHKSNIIFSLCIEKW